MCPYSTSWRGVDLGRVCTIVCLFAHKQLDCVPTEDGPSDGQFGVVTVPARTPALAQVRSSTSSAFPPVSSRLLFHACFFTPTSAFVVALPARSAFCCCSCGQIRLLLSLLQPVLEQFWNTSVPLRAPADMFPSSSDRSSSSEFLQLTREMSHIRTHALLFSVLLLLYRLSGLWPMFGIVSSLSSRAC